MKRLLLTLALLIPAFAPVLKASAHEAKVQQKASVHEESSQHTGAPLTTSHKSSASEAKIKCTSAPEAAVQRTGAHEAKVQLKASVHEESSQHTGAPLATSHKSSASEAKAQRSDTPIATSREANALRPDTPRSTSQKASAHEGSLQLPDTLEATAQKVDTLEATVFTGKNRANYISEGKALRTEVVSSAGLMKMACCNLAESFENSASVTVGYSDATTGARQIRLLGLSGIYVQLLDESRPIMRGLISPFGLSYIPSPWLESIQIAKGSPSVVGGVESMTGQINMEFRKPTDEKPLFINASIMNDTKTDLNIASSLQVSDKLYTTLLGHADGNFKTMDMNGDGFKDDPSQRQLNIANRWLYYTPTLQVRWGFRASTDSRQGGQVSGPWTSDVNTSSINPYLKIGRPLREDGSASVALVADYSYGRMDASFGNNSYKASQQSVFANLIYRNKLSDAHDITAGVNSTLDFWDEDILASGGSQKAARQSFSQVSPYIEYTFKHSDVLTAIVGAACVAMEEGFRIVPRGTLRYQPTESLVLRANGGRGLRRSNPVVDNFGILSTGKSLIGDLTERILEDSWIFGGNATYTIGQNSSISLDWFRTVFAAQALLDRESPTRIRLYSLDGNKSFSNNLQADFSTEPLEGLSFNLTARHSAAKVWQPSGHVREVPLSSRFKGVFNAQYKTRLSRWIFDFTASLTGSSRVYDFMKDLKDTDGAALYKDGRTPAYPLFYAQVTRRFKGVDIYIGGENLGAYRQKAPIIGAEDPFSPTFDAASVWGPIMGAKLYAGFRVTVWK